MCWQHSDNPGVSLKPPSKPPPSPSQMHHPPDHYNHWNPLFQLGTHIGACPRTSSNIHTPSGLRGLHSEGPFPPRLLAWPPVQLSGAWMWQILCCPQQGSCAAGVPVLQQRWVPANGSHLDPPQKAAPGEFLLWHSELRIQHCLCSGTGSIPSPAQWIKDLVSVRRKKEVSPWPTYPPHLGVHACPWGAATCNQ